MSPANTATTITRKNPLITASAAEGTTTPDWRASRKRLSPWPSCRSPRPPYFNDTVMRIGIALITPSVT